MQAEIIAIGDEILIGQTVDTNSAFIATRLNSIGIKVAQKRVIADEAGAIERALDDVLSDTVLVFTTGGLGPTKDDITKKTLNGYFGGELVFNEKVYQNIVKLFRSFNRTPSEINRSQAFLPSSCKPVLNKIGTASGMHFKQGKRHYFSLPGVPYETEYLVENKIIPWISENLQKGNVVHRTLLTQGVPESELAEKIADWENSLPLGISLAYLPSPGLVRLRLSSYEEDSKEALKKINRKAKELREILGDIIFGENAQTLEEVIGISLKQKKATLSTAESCTGGYIAHLITSVPGSSEYFMGSIVSYSNRAKKELLEVNMENIVAHGAVSQEVIEQMAEGARQKFHTDFAIATSGIAGPTGGTDEKPVGTVWIAVAGPQRIIARQFRFGKNRERNIRKSALMALDMLRREIQKFQS